MSSKLDNKFGANSISKLYLHSETADVHFAFTSDGEQKKVPAHKSILAIASPVFHAMFFGAMREDEVVKIVDASASEFMEFLQFFYLPEVTLTMANIEAVARLADKYDMLSYVKACAEFLETRLTTDNMIWGYQLAISINNEKLQRFCETEIKKLASDFFKSDMFLHCDKSVVETILQLDELRVNKIDLFNAVIEWAKIYCQAEGLNESDPDNLKNQLGGCLYLIRFGAMTNREIGTIVLNEQLSRLFSRDELKDLLCMVTVDGFQSKVFECTPRTVTSRTFEWNGKKDLVCEVAARNGDQARLQPLQSTWFTTNWPVILGEMDFINIWGFSLYLVQSNISIIEYDDHSFKMNNSTKILYKATQTMVYIGREIASVRLPQPIEIRPEKMYEIRMEVTTLADIFCLTSQWKTEVQLNDEVTIKIHENPSRIQDPGSVSKLHFNQI